MAVVAGATSLSELENAMAYCLGAYCPGAYCLGAYCPGAYCLGAYCLGAYCPGAYCLARRLLPRRLLPGRLLRYSAAALLRYCADGTAYCLLCLGHHSAAHCCGGQVSPDRHRLW
jgi:hypothetical protein